MSSFILTNGAVCRIVSTFASAMGDTAISRLAGIVGGSVALITALGVFHACASLNTPLATEAIALVGVTVVDASSSEPPPSEQTILIAGGVIRAVGPSSAITIPAGARRIDARGKFAIPGLWDTHVHFMNTGVTALPLLVANGVTSVREMGGYIEH